MNELSDNELSTFIKHLKNFASFTPSLFSTDFISAAKRIYQTILKFYIRLAKETIKMIKKGSFVEASGVLLSVYHNYLATNQYI